MARPRSFDEQSVLNLAMHAFRRTGYAAVSVQELAAAAGLSTGSIYNSFGDKGRLFDAAFAYYLENVLQRRIATYAGVSAGLEGVRRLFVSLLHEPRDESFGCLITNCAVEFGATDTAREAKVLEGFEILRAALNERLVRAREARVLRASIEPAVAAVRLLALYQGILVLVRSGFDKQRLDQAINAEFDALEVGPEDTAATV
ncbi:TetR/AcrR family transcriptional regulator [Duganella sp. HH101]|uniref:TetR/AcrR family transcriptional regulator n=1 Tax=Duganella sp. HH101 TaxID=1781066 RepID=UPI000874D887|nr:TetR/AcrR family transcriptional regulator [Duganella sp. HH101]OFA01039.1 HTH-type transcriptional repressor ComR [Duganella sp. HH101]